MQFPFSGIDIPEPFDKQAKWLKAFVEWVRSQLCGYATATTTLQSGLSQYEFVDHQIKQVSNQRAYHKQHRKEGYM